MTADSEEFYRQWEYYIQKFYAEFQTQRDIFNYDKLIEIQLVNAEEYAHSAINHLFMLNGGALIALPAIIAAFHLPNNIRVWTSGVSYAAGLVLVILTTLFAFWSVEYSAM